MLIRTMLALLICGTLSATLTADILNMKDGRRIEGEIIHQEAGLVTIDAMISDIRAKLTFAEDDIEKIIREDVAPDFYERKDIVPDKRVSDKNKFKSSDILYLTIPVKGKVGVDFEAKSLSRIMSYAKRYRIEHLVFDVDSSHGGNLDEARRIVKLLKANQERFNYHALITNCQGDAMSIAVTADRLVLLPGAKIGGGLNISMRADKDPAAKMEDELVLRQQLGIDIEKYMNSRGRPGKVVRAMVDPYAELVAWVNEDGEPEFDTVISGSTDESKIVFQTEPGKTLMLTAEQAYQLGAPKFSGSIETYGTEVLKRSNWTKESDYAEKIVKDNAKVASKRAAATEKRFDHQVKRNIERRIETKKNLEHHLAGAKDWDPKKVKLTTKKYQQLHRYRGWGWGRGDYYERSTYDTNNLTDESRIEHTRHTDASLQHLAHAVRAIGALKRLDKEAVKLGLAPTYQSGELDMMYNKIKPRFEELKANRGKKTK